MLIFFITNEKHNLFQPLFEGEQSELEIENESCAVKVSVCSHGKIHICGIDYRLKGNIYQISECVCLRLSRDVCIFLSVHT